MALLCSNFPNIFGRYQWKVCSEEICNLSPTDGVATMAASCEAFITFCGLWVGAVLDVTVQAFVAAPDGGGVGSASDGVDTIAALAAGQTARQVAAARRWHARTWTGRRRGRRRAPARKRFGQRRFVHWLFSHPKKKMKRNRYTHKFTCWYFENLKKIVSVQLIWIFQFMGNEFFQSISYTTRVTWLESSPTGGTWTHLITWFRTKIVTKGGQLRQRVASWLHPFPCKFTVTKNNQGFPHSIHFWENLVFFNFSQFSPHFP